MVAGLLSGCVLQLNPVTSETHVVTAVTDPTKTVTIPEGMVWYDTAFPTRGLRFPPGTYALEAEDADYWYLRSAATLEMRVFDNGKVTDSRNVPGGIMLAKHFNLVPGAGYIDGEGSTKIMVWKLGNDFLRREGSSWRKTF